MTSKCNLTLTKLTDRRVKARTVSTRDQSTILSHSISQLTNTISQPASLSQNLDIALIELERLVQVGNNPTPQGTTRRACTCRRGGITHIAKSNGPGGALRTTSVSYARGASCCLPRFSGKTVGGECPTHPPSWVPPMRSGW
jgi:hypothetical protein